MSHHLVVRRAWLVCIAALGTLSAARVFAEPATLTDAQLGFQGGPRSQVLAQCKLVGLLPVPRPTLHGADPEASARIEAAVTRALEQAGLTVAPPDSFTTAYDRFNRAVGGIYDPMLGTVRRDAFAGVNANAIREYVAKEQLDCIAVARAVEAKASIQDNTATWDGAVEYVDGQAKGGLTRVLTGSANNGTGFLSAISIAVQLQTREGKVLYSYRGGVQLENYLDRQHGNEASDILVVPRAQLLLDDRRIERAVSFVTEPLRYTPEQIAAGSKDPAINTTLILPRDLPLLPAGQTPHEMDIALKVPREQILSRIHRVAFGPIDPSALGARSDVVTRYHDLVRSRLARLGWEVVDSDTLAAALGKAMREGNGFYDPLTGSVLPDRLRSEFQTAMKSIAMSPPPDAVLTVTLIKSPAAQKWGNVAWDGTTQNALTLGAAIQRPRLLGGNEDVSAGEGSINASSLQVLLRDADGTMLYAARGGIELLQQLSLARQVSAGRINFLQQLTDRAPAELFKDPARDEHAVDAALRQLLLSPAELAAQVAAR
jgi:hypothetical protein